MTERKVVTIPIIKLSNFKLPNEMVEILRKKLTEKEARQVKKKNRAPIHVRDLEEE